MNGIFGIVYKNESEEKKLKINVEKIKSMMHNRGPDSDGEYQDSKCHLVCTKMNVHDNDDTIAQPYQYNGKILIYSGEIYNYVNLRKQLMDKGYTFKSYSDAEIIIKSYMEYGNKFVDKFIGIFAFCLYDTKKDEVVIYRDRLGVKPLYYYDNSDMLIFGSDITTICECIDSRNNKILPNSISSYLSFRHVIGTSTFYSQIKKVPAGNYILVHRNIASLYSYWNLLPSQIDYIPDFFKCMDELKELFYMAVKRNLPIDENVNIFMSGGLDSSAIVATINELMRVGEIPLKKIMTYSIGFDTDNEFEYATLVSKHFNTDHQNIITNTDEYIDSMIDLIKFKGEPLNLPNEPLINIMSKIAKKFGNMALTGVGADELFYGYGKLFISFYNYMNDDSIPFYEFFINRYSHLDMEFKSKLYKPEFWVNTLKNDLFIQQTFDGCFRECEGMHDQDRIGYVMLKLHLPCLLARLDNASSNASFECRVPYLDHELVEYCFYRIPRDMKIKWLKDVKLMELIKKDPAEISEIMDSPKYILKELFSKLLPMDVISRKKVNFVVPLERIIMEKYEIILRLLESGYINEWNIFDLEGLKHRLSVYKLEGNDAYAIWMLINLEIFLQLFVKNKPVEEIRQYFMVDHQYKLEKGALIATLILPRDVQIIRYIKLYVIKELLKKHGIDYFAYGSTMLGCVRHKGFIPWNDSINFMIMEDQCGKITEELRMELLYAGFQIIKSKEGFKILDFLDGNFFVNLFTATYTDTRKTTINYSAPYCVENFTGREIKTADVFPLTDYSFGFFTITGMNNPHNHFVKCNYGDYMKYAPISHTYDPANNKILSEFLQKYRLQNVIIREQTLLSYSYDVVYTDDWISYFSRAKSFIPDKFLPHNYKMLNSDLYSYDTIQLYIHYIKSGRFENRPYIIDDVIPLDFDIKGYRCLNPDLEGDDSKLLTHYISVGRNEGRKYNMQSLLPMDFSSDAYKYLNPDLDGFTENKLIYHYIHVGRSEKRLYNKDLYLPNDFDFKKYLELNPDLKSTINNERNSVIHFIVHGRLEGRKYK